MPLSPIIVIYNAGVAGLKSGSSEDERGTGQAGRDLGSELLIEEKTKEG